MRSRSRTPSRARPPTGCISRGAAGRATSSKGPHGPGPATPRPPRPRPPKHMEPKEGPGFSGGVREAGSPATRGAVGPAGTGTASVSSSAQETAVPTFGCVRTRPALTEGWLPFSHLNPRFSFPESFSQSFSSQTLYSFISFLSFVEIQPENSGFVVSISHLTDYTTRPGHSGAHVLSHQSHARHGAVSRSQGETLSQGRKAARRLPPPAGTQGSEAHPTQVPAPHFAKCRGPPSRPACTKSICVQPWLRDGTGCGCAFRPLGGGQLEPFPASRARVKTGGLGSGPHPFSGDSLPCRVLSKRQT